MKGAFLLLLVACATAPVARGPLPPPVHGPKLVPVYEWSKDKTLTGFQSQMLEVCRAGDGKRLFEHLDPNVRTSFGPKTGIEGFKMAWYTQPHWEELLAIFFMGGGSFRDNDHFVAPSVYANWPERFDPYSFVAVMSRGVPLRESPDAKSKAVAILSFDIVKPLGEKGHVRLADGRVGWVDPKFLWSPVGYHVELVRERGTWKIEALVSGR